MKPLSRFLSLSRSRKRRLLQAWFLLVRVRFALRLLPFGSVRRRLDAWAARPVGRRTSATAEELAWAVRAAARGAPGGRHCLTRALVTHALLVRHGHEVRIGFGVKRKGRNDLLAHAWVECDGKVLMGGEDLDGYEPLRPVHESRRERPGRAPTSS